MQNESASVNVQPPDIGLCVGNGFVIEIVNQVQIVALGKRHVGTSILRCRCQRLLTIALPCRHLPLRNCSWFGHLLTQGMGLLPTWPSNHAPLR